MTVSRESANNKRRVVRLVTVVTLMFAISWLPIQLILLLKSTGLYPVTIVNISIQVRPPWQSDYLLFTAFRDFIKRVSHN